jgi:hypothetical protein
MKTTIRSAGLMILGIGLLTGGCATNSSISRGSNKNPEVVAQLKSFIAEKEAQEGRLVEADEKDYSAENFQSELPDLRPYFAAAKQGDWLTVSNLWGTIEERVSSLTETTNKYPNGMWLQPVRETGGAIKAFVYAGDKYSKIFGDDIIQSIPPGSIYFGGSDPGRFVVTTLEKSQVKADPFFTLTQNQLVDIAYIKYLQLMYGERIYIPSNKDLQKSFQEYTEDAYRRFKKNQLKPGENVNVTGGGVQVSGRVALMGINALLAKIIFEENTNREFYVEESFPLDWMYPYLEPHGLIFKLNRQPLPELSDEIVRRDHDYWTNCIAPMIGDWLNDDTTIEEVAAFAEKVYARQDFGGFTGDPHFVWNAYWHSTFSTERCAIADLYVWRAEHAASDSGKKRMQAEADFAFRQSWALCPASVEAIFRYVNLLANENRVSDAILVVKTALKMPQLNDHDAPQVRVLLKQLEQMQQQQLKKQV